MAQRVDGKYSDTLDMLVSAGLAGGTAVLVMQQRCEALFEDMRAVVLAYVRTVLYTAGPIRAVVAGQWIGHHPLGPALRQCSPSFQA
ncbi:MAG: hypothetical protein ACP5QO_09935 [Clostridia bacterium]